MNQKAMRCQEVFTQRFFADDVLRILFSSRSIEESDKDYRSFLVER